MSFRRASRGLRLRPVKTIKHIVDSSGLVILDTQSITDVVNTVEAPVSSVSNNVSNGSTVHAIYLRVEVKGGAVSASGVENFYMAVYKNPGNNIAGPANLDNIGVSDKRRFILHQEMMMTTPATAESGFPRTMFKGVIVLPRTFKRMGIDDKLQVLLQQKSGETNQTTQFCIQCIYKEFR